MKWVKVESNWKTIRFIDKNGPKNLIYFGRISVKARIPTIIRYRNLKTWSTSHSSQIDIDQGAFRVGSHHSGIMVILILKDGRNQIKNSASYHS
ncbi:uncharacterized protein TrAFT101_005712 [Trichoderma asperellum]|uniref:uncharacterized protein n=1 Tax=Trichoderma asperellum TaxID=101201 RepID=UPI0033242196|nr:hypothetical protein TrAFT101_005712 [Trichoderma asperellum]